MIFNSPIVRFFLVFFVSFGLISLTEYANDSYGIVGQGKGLIYVVNVLSTIVYACVMGVMDSRLVIKNHWSRLAYRFLLLTILPGILAIQHASYIPLTLALMNYAIFYYTFEMVYDHEKHMNPYSVGKTSLNDRVVNWLNYNTFLGRLFPGWYAAMKVTLMLIGQVAVMHYFF